MNIRGAEGIRAGLTDEEKCPEGHKWQAGLEGVGTDKKETDRCTRGCNGHGWDGQWAGGEHGRNRRAHKRGGRGSRY